jgi:hypothetical protein
VLPESLELLQRRFWRLISAQDGVSMELPNVAEDDPGAAPLVSWIAAPDEESACERLDVYANMYFFRLLEALEQHVPKVAQLLGPQVFDDLVASYLAAHPSTNPSLRHLAAALPDFLTGHQVALDRPDLPDLARLELTRNDVFDGPDSPTLDAASLATIAPESWPALRFELAPTVRWLRLRASAVATWRALAEQAPIPEPTSEQSGCVVWRSRVPGSEDQVWHRAATLTEVIALDAVAAGASFDRICEIFAADLPALPADAAEAARPALEALVRWVRHGLLTDVKQP